jgi:transposase-like protein
VIAAIGFVPQTLRAWVMQGEKDNGLRGDVTTQERDRIKALERSNCARHRCILRALPTMFTSPASQRDGTGQPARAMNAFIDDQRIVYGVGWRVALILQKTLN